MKIFVLAALLATVLASSRQSGDTQEWPWKVGKVYHYDVDSYTLASLQEGTSSGNAFKARFIIYAKGPGQLLARLENPQRATVHEQLRWKLPKNKDLPNNRDLPVELKYDAVQNLDKPFEIFLDGGRVKSLNVPDSLSTTQENLLKGLIGTLQVDLSNNRREQNENKYDSVTLQGSFKKMETDVTGDCSTLYTASPVNSEWHRELPQFSNIEEPIEITKSKNYGHCHHRVDYHFGLPQGAKWAGLADSTKEFQFIQRGSNSRILIGRQGPIYKAETTSTVYVHPHQYGKQKAEVLSYVRLNLVSYEDMKEPQWEQPENKREVQNLLYSMSNKGVTIKDDSSSSEESQEQTRRVARKIISMNKVIIKKRLESKESDSSSASDSAYINENLPKNTEAAYSALYMTPKTQSEKQYPAVAQKLVQELAQLLQATYNMPKADFLTKFNILVRVIASMNSEELAQTSHSIEATKSSNNIVKTDMWMIFRDAVAQSGTMPAFKQIQSWIQSKKLHGEEAAEVVATLAYTVRFPTKNLMLQFFNLALSPEVTEQKYLNSAALIAATRLINLGHVNNETAHSFYPTHMFGRMTRKHDRFVLEDVLPRLRKGLDEAIQKNDIQKAQVFIKAIGNIGHRAILDVFAPYIEGKIVVSTYLRTLIVDNLRILAKTKDSYVRSALFNILRNRAEPHEVRLSAIENIFIAHPTPAMMQAMAMMSHDDPSVHVRAFIKSSIESTADMKDPRYWELIKTAQGARPLVTKEHFGHQYSNRRYQSHADDDMDFSIMDVLSYVGSDDSMFPKYSRFSMKGKTSRWNEISASFSSVKTFAEHVANEMKSMWKQPPKSDVELKYSTSKIGEMLDIKRDPHEPIHGDLYFNLMNQERYFTFSEEDLKKIPQTMKTLMTELATGKEMHYTKILNQAQISVMFPLAMGMPFIYKYKEPTVVHIQAKAQGQLNFGKNKKDLSASIKKDVQFTLARNIDGMVGFLDTLSNQWASVGIVSKVQVDVPIKTEVQWKSGELKIRLEPLRPDQDVTLVHYSVWPYSSNQKKDSLVPVSLDTTTKVIVRDSKVSNMDYRFGQALGSVFQFQGYSYSSDYRNVATMFQSSDFFANIARILYQRDIAMTHYNLRYLGKSSQNKKIILTAAYDTYNNMQESMQQPLAPIKTEDVAPNSSARREKMVKRVVSGIKTAKAHVVDLSATFEGPQKMEYVLTAAIGHSPVDPKVQYALFAGINSKQGNNQLNGVGTVKKPEVTALNFLEALKKDLKMNFEAEIKYGNENSDIRVQGYTERSKKFAESLKSYFRAQECQEEMTQGNKYQHACHKMLMMAHAQDYLKASVSYKGISPAVQYYLQKIYGVMKHYNFWYTESNPLKTIPEGKAEIEMQNDYMNNLMNLVINNRNGETRVKNMPIPKVSAKVMSTYFPISVDERVMNYFSSHQYLPYCTIDANKVKTFSQRTLGYTLTKSWHVVMQNQAIKTDWPADELVVLAKRLSEKMQEIYISYRSDTGKALELEIKPSNNKPSVKVNTNAKKVSEGDLTMYWDDVEEMPFLQYHTQKDGVLMLNIRDNRLRMMFDGETLVVLSNEDRNKTRGICGLMSGEIRDDYLTPRGLVDKASHFAASYSLDVENPDSETLSLKSQAQKLAYERKHQYTSFVQNQNDWHEQMQQDAPEDSSETIYRVRGYSKQTGHCQLVKQVQYFEKNGQICITTTPLDSCQAHCRGKDYKIQQTEVVCEPWSDLEFQQYRNMIQRGENPQVTVTGSGESRMKQYKVPASCKA